MGTYPSRSIENNIERNDSSDKKFNGNLHILLLLATVPTNKGVSYTFFVEQMFLIYVYIYPLLPSFINLVLENI